MTTSARPQQRASAPSPAAPAPERTLIEDIIESTEARRKIEPFLQRGTSIDRIAQAVALACAENPELLQCKRWSIVDAVATIQKWGLEIGETAYLVPFNVKVSKRGEPDKWEKRCKAIRGYKGIVQQMREVKSVRNVAAHPVFEGEHFVLHQGSQPSIEHHPHTVWQGKRPKMIGAYAVVWHAFGYTSIKYMTVEEVDAIRQSSSKQWKEGPVPAWYACKTALNQLGKMFRGRAEFAQVVDAIDQDELQELSELHEDRTPTAPAPTDEEEPDLSGSPPLEELDLEIPTGRPNRNAQLD